jgi:bacteriorhodopsin
MFEWLQSIATSTAIMRSWLWQFKSVLLKCLSVFIFRSYKQPKSTRYIYKLLVQPHLMLAAMY